MPGRINCGALRHERLHNFEEMFGKDGDLDGDLDPT